MTASVSKLYTIWMKNSKTIIARNKRNCCLKQSSIEHSDAVDVITVTLMQHRSYGTNDNVSGWKRWWLRPHKTWSCSDECKWVCMCKRVCILTYLNFITFERSPLARGRQPETTTVVLFSNNKGRSGHKYESERVDNLPTYLV